MTAWLSGCGADMLASLAQVPGSRSAGFQIQQAPGQPQQRNSLTSAVSLSRRVASPLPWPCSSAGRSMASCPLSKPTLGGLLTGQARQQRQHGAAQRRRAWAGYGSEADAVWAVIDALVQVRLARDLARELRDVDAQAVGRVQAGSMYQTSEMG
jgi:hypothetical protein